MNYLKKYLILSKYRGWIMNKNYNIINEDKVKISNQVYSKGSINIFSKMFLILSILFGLIGIVSLPIGMLFLLISLFLFFTSKTYANIFLEMKNFRKKEINTQATNENIENSKEKTLPIYSKKTIMFEHRIDDYILKWKYYDVQVAGTEYRDINYSKLEINGNIQFIKDTNNEYDANAIKIMQNNIFLGYIHRGNIQEMLQKYLDNDNYFIYSKLNLIDEEHKKIQIQIGFYKLIEESDYNVIKKINTTLIKTSKKVEEYQTSRQEALCFVEEDDRILLEEQYDSDCYLVLSDSGDELGELSESMSNKISEYINNSDYEIIATIKELTENDSGKYGAKIEIIILEQK